VTHTDLAALLGHPVRMTFRDSKWGDLTVRWGRIRAINPDTLTIDDYHDSAGIGAYLPGRGCNVHDGVSVTTADIIQINRTA